MSFKKFVKKNKLGSINNKTTFKTLTTMKVGGKIKCLYYPNNIESLKKAIDYINTNKIKHLLIGNGSNIIASDKTYRGIVISSKHLPHNINIDNDIITVSAFYDLRRLVSFTVGRDINTFTNLAGIPGTVGGALYMNASAFGTKISDNLINVTYLLNNEVITKNKDELMFEYRNSEFAINKAVILEAKFRVIHDENIFMNYNEILNKRKKSHPILFPNSGSIFRNPENKKAYEVIKELDLAGYSKGSAQISMKHANFIINTGHATGKDVYSLIKHIKTKAKKINKELKEEVILFNF